jgi:hypothetical protein
MKYVIVTLLAIVVFIFTMSIVVNSQVVTYPIYTLTYAPVSTDESLVYYITTVTIQSSEASAPQTVLEYTTGTFMTDPEIGSVTWTELYGFLSIEEANNLKDAWGASPYCEYGPRGSISYLSITQSQLEEFLGRNLAKTPHKALSTQVFREDDTQKTPVTDTTYSLDVRNYSTPAQSNPSVAYTIYEVYGTTTANGTQSPILQFVVGNYSSQTVSEQVNWTALYGFKSATEANYVIKHWPGGAGNSITQETLVHELLRRSLAKVPSESLTSKVSKIQP